MSKEFSSELQIIVAADPEAVWQAIATGPGLDAWYMGRNQVAPPAPNGTGGLITTVMGDYTPTSDILAWDPPHRLAHKERADSDGRFLAFEYLIEGRDDSTSVVRLVVDGFLPQDDWEDEFEAMTLGGALYFASMGECAAHFVGRTATPVTAFSPPVEDWEATWRQVRADLGLGDTVSVGDVATVRLPGQDPIAGTVYEVNLHTLGIRTDTALLRILRGFNGTLMTMHSVFEPVDSEAYGAWTVWLAEAVTPSPARQGADA